MQFHIAYQHSVDGITADQLKRLRSEWVDTPSPEVNLKSLQNMNAVTLAVDKNTDEVIGLVCGFSDHTLILYVWDLEVIPEYRGHGIEQEMLRAFLDEFGDLYQVNAHPILENFHLFESLGFKAYSYREAIPLTIINRALQGGKITS